MVIKFSRAQRRHDRARMYKKARKLQELWWSWPQSKGDPLWGGGHIDEDTMHSATSRLRDNMKCCSCWQCGNPRRSGFGYKYSITMQERKADYKYKDELKENDMNEGVGSKRDGREDEGHRDEGMGV